MTYLNCIKELLLYHGLQGINTGKDVELLLNKFTYNSVSKQFDLKPGCKVTNCEKAFIDELGPEQNRINRAKGQTYYLKDYVRAMIFALLSNNRPWGPIANNIKVIDSIFNGYNPSWIKAQNPDDFINAIRGIKCGNRRIKYQMEALSHNIAVLEKIEKDYGTIDNYINSNISTGNAKGIINDLAFGKYKIREMGIPLVCEFLKAVGADICKPDLHVVRFVGAERMGWIQRNLTSAKEKDCWDTIDLISKISNQTNFSCCVIDALIWNFCNEERGKCGEIPDCNRNNRTFICPLCSTCNF